MSGSTSSCRSRSSTSASKPRPALVLSAPTCNGENGHTVLAMITRGAPMRWPSDVAIADLRPTGLRAPSVVRWKLFTLDNRVVRRGIGALAAADRRRCAAMLKTLFA